VKNKYSFDNPRFSQNLKQHFCQHHDKKSLSVNRTLEPEQSTTGIHLILHNNQDQRSSFLSVITVQNNAIARPPKNKA
jgi:hypothetical protein